MQTTKDEHDDFISSITSLELLGVCGCKHAIALKVGTSGTVEVHVPLAKQKH